jgi:hypothetical protein
MGDCCARSGGETKSAATMPQAGSKKVTFNLAFEGVVFLFMFSPC